MDDKLELAIKLRFNKEYIKAELLFKELVLDHPLNALIYYHYAWLCDVMERETEAYPKYEKAIELGLKGKELEGCLLGLGSTYRSIGMYSKAIEVFEKAIEKFPENMEFYVFKAMALYNVNDHKEAMNLLLNVIAKTSRHNGVNSYKKAIEYYSNNLDKVFI